jgi:hypothetical protein
MEGAFWYNGWQYVQQGRRCNKPTCACVDGALHGPYWYRRQKSGKREYVGRELNTQLVQAVTLRESFYDTVGHHLAVMQGDSDLLTDMIQGTRTLDVEDRHRLDELGYGLLIPIAD